MQPEEQPSYQDDETSLAGEAASSDRDNAPSFPQQLMEVLSNERLSDVVSWLPHGQGWIIHDKKRFAVEVLPVYFEKKSKWTSFTRKLNRWNFTRVTRGDEVGAYYHPLFKRDNKDLCLQMNCLGSKMAQNLEPLNPVALGLATPKMIEHGLLSGMVPKRSMHSTKKKKAAMPSEQQSTVPPSSSSFPGPPSLSPPFPFFQSSIQLADSRTTPPLPPSNSVAAAVHLNPPRHTFPNTSIPSTAEGIDYVDQQQPPFLGTIGNPLTTSAYGGMVLPELRNASQSPHHGRRPTSPNPLLPAFVSAAFLQPSPNMPTSSSSYPSSSSSWTHQQAAPAGQQSLFSQHHTTTPTQPQSYAVQQPPNNQLQDHHRNMIAYMEALNQRIIHTAPPQDTLTLTPTPALSHHSSVEETPRSGGGQQPNRGLVEGLQQPLGTSSSSTAWSPDDHSGHDISPSMFDTTSSSSDQGSGVHHLHDHYTGGGPPRGPRESSSSEKAGKISSPTTRFTNTSTFVPTSPRRGAPGRHQEEQQHYQGMIGQQSMGGGGNSNTTIVGSLVVPPGAHVRLFGGDQQQTPLGSTASLLSSSTQQHAAAALESSGQSSTSTMGFLDSILGQTRKDIHDLLQQQQQSRGGGGGGGGALSSPSTMQSIVRGNEKGSGDQRTPPGEEQPQQKR